MNSKAGIFEYNKIKLLQSLQTFFSLTPTRYYHDFNRYLDEIKPDYVNTDEAESLLTNVKGCIKFYIDNIHIQDNIQNEIDDLPFNDYNGRLIEDLLHYLDDKSLKMYHRIFELEKRVRNLEDQIEVNNQLNTQTHHFPKKSLLFEE